MGEYVRVLGPLTVDLSGTGDVDRSALGPAQRRLLAMLCAKAGMVVSVERLMDGLGVTSPGSVRSNVSRVRRLLGQSLKQESTGYLIDSAVVDSHRFVHLVADARQAKVGDAVRLYDEALGLWRGTAFEEFLDEEWASAEAVWLDEARVTAQEERIDALIETGRLSDAIGDAERLVAEHPLREGPRSQLMRSLTLDGRQTEALRAFNDFQRFLAAEVGVEPSADLWALEQRIVGGEFGQGSGQSRDGVATGQNTGSPSTRPSGIVTFLFTDVEGSTRLWASDADAMSAAVQRHDVIVRDALDEHGGYVFATGGDSFAAAFDRVSTAIAAAEQIQASLAHADWDGGFELQVRIGIHSGEAEERDGDYFGPVVNTASRVSAAAHGGQTVLTAHALRAAGSDKQVTVDLGEHLLRDIESPVHIFQLGAGQFARLRATSLGASSLPKPRTSLIGSESMVNEVRKLLVENRLVTITGVGGGGKTRLAVEVAEREADSHPQGVWFVNLAAIADTTAVTGAIAAALELSTDSHSPADEQIAGYLAPRQAVLVVDNCEHVIDEAAAILDVILGRAPNLRILATSREPLEIDGEHAWRIPSMKTGPNEAGVQLFIDRASSATGSFSPDAETVAVIAEICERLDGIPLAIELAATRARAMSVVQLRDNLDDRFQLLSGGRRRLRDRRQTLEATVRWSYDLLTDHERAMLRRLSVFQAGFDLEDVAAVADVSRGVAIDLVDALVAKSMVGVSRTNSDATRHYLLETIRLFALAELTDEGAESAARDAHLDHYVGDPRIWDWEAWSTDEAQIRIESELENLRAAAGWAIQSDRPCAATTIACAIYDALTARGELADALALLEQPAELPRDLDVKRLTIAAHLEVQRFNLDVGSSKATEAIELADGEPYDLVPFAHFVGARAQFFLGDVDAWARAAAAMAVVAPKTSAKVVNGALVRLAQAGVAGVEYDLLTVIEVTTAGIAEAPDFHARDLLAIFRDLSLLGLADVPESIRTIDVAPSKAPSYTTPWSYMHVIMPILQSVPTVGPRSAGLALADAAPEMVARRPGVIGDWLAAFAHLHAELGDYSRANELIDGAVVLNLFGMDNTVRFRQGLPVDWSHLNEPELLSRFIRQPELFQQEIEYWAGVALESEAASRN